MGREPTWSPGRHDVEVWAARCGQAGEVAGVAGRWNVRGVRREGRELKEEGVVAPSAAENEAGTPVGQDVGQIVRRSVAVLTKAPILVQRVVKLGITPSRDVPLAPAGRNIGRRHVGAPAIRGLTGWLHIAIEVFPHQSGHVAPVTQGHREGVKFLAAIVKGRKAAGRSEVREDPGVVGKPAAEHRCA